jgi:hypothetical protein
MPNPGHANRRGVVAAGLLLAGSCFAGVDPRALFAHAAQTGRPLLTPKALNALIPKPAEGRAYAEFLRGAADDLPGFLAQRFALTDEQRRKIATIAPDQLRALGDALREAEAKSAGVETDELWTKIKRFFDDDKAVGRLELTTRFDGKNLIIGVSEVTLPL